MNSSCCIDGQIAYICNNEYDFFFAKQNVVGIGLGYKVKNNISTNKKCITVFVKHKLPSNNISLEDLIPKTFKGIIIDVVESGDMIIESCDKNRMPCLDRSLTGKIRPVLGGYGISPANSTKLGTMGCVVKDMNNTYILSCNHALHQYGTIPIDTPIVQPSFGSGGIAPKDTIAKLSSYVPISFSKANSVDAAIAAILNKKDVLPQIALTNGPKGTKPAKLGETVKMVGASSELTTGKITGVNVTMNVTIEGKSVLFTDQITTNIVSKPGDSGAILLSNDDYAIGMHMASNQTTKVELANDMIWVLRLLGVSLVTV